jgi:hypothetical protein
MTIPGLDAETTARELGAGGVDNIVTNAERVCSYESERITLTNESAIVGLQAQFNLLRVEERYLEARLHLAPPSGNLRRLRLRALYYWSLTALLIAAGFVFALLSFEPFRLGWKSWLYCAGIAALTPFLVEKLLDGPRMERVVKALTVAAAVAAIVGLMLLAVIRGNLLSQEIRANDTTAVVLDDAPPQAPPPQNDFYESTLTLLRVTLLLFAFAMELGAGLALHEAWRTAPDDSEDWNKLRAELATTRLGMAHIARQAAMLRNEPAIFAARFWRDFYMGLLTKAARSAMTKLSLYILIALLIPALARAQDGNGLNLVIAIDLTQSVAHPEPDGTDDFRKNIDGVTRILADIPAGTSVNVIGITDHSFTEPYILLRGQVPRDPGYFGERLDSARRQLVGAWKTRTSRLDARFTETDIFGPLALASQIFGNRPGASQKTLVIFSDMRESTPELDFESLQTVPPYGTLVKQCGALPDLSKVQVYVLGVDGAGKSLPYWRSLSAFWQDYFCHAGAKLRSYAVLRELPHGSLLGE